MPNQFYKIIMRCPGCKRIIDESLAMILEDILELRKKNRLKRRCFRCDRKARPSTISVG